MCVYTLTLIHSHTQRGICISIESHPPTIHPQQFSDGKLNLGYWVLSLQWFNIPKSHANPAFICKYIPKISLYMCLYNTLYLGVFFVCLFLVFYSDSKITGKQCPTTSIGAYFFKCHLLLIRTNDIGEGFIIIIKVKGKQTKKKRTKKELYCDRLIQSYKTSTVHCRTRIK